MRPFSFREGRGFVGKRCRRQRLGYSKEHIWRRWDFLPLQFVKKSDMLYAVNFDVRFQSVRFPASLRRLRVWLFQ